MVEDDSDLRKSLVRLFEKEKFNVFQCSGGHQAFNLFQGINIDVIFSDARMPEGTGIELLQKVRKINSLTPIFIIATGFSDYKEQQILSMGAQAVITKPFQKKKFYQF